jgi:hypothetical protein
VISPRESRVYFSFRGANGRTSYCYLRFPPEFLLSIPPSKYKDGILWFGDKIAALSGLVLRDIRIRHSWTIGGKRTDADTDASVAQNAILVFLLSDGEYRSVAIPCKPPVGGGWKYTTELDGLAADMVGNAGIIRRSDLSSPWFSGYQGAYYALDFNQKGDRKWKK